MSGGYPDGSLVRLARLQGGAWRPTLDAREISAYAFRIILAIGRNGSPHGRLLMHQDVKLRCKPTSDALVHAVMGVRQQNATRFGSAHELLQPMKRRIAPAQLYRRESIARHSKFARYRHEILLMRQVASPSPPAGSLRAFHHAINHALAGGRITVQTASPAERRCGAKQ